MSTTRGAAGDRDTRVRILHHFHEGAERVASRAVFDEFERQSGLTVEESLEDISRLRLQVKSQILRQESPDVWDEWPGQNLRPSVDAGVTADITDVWEAEGFDRTFIDQAAEASRFDGEYHCVPLDVYRTNTLYYNREVTERLGVSPDRIDDPAAFVDVLETVADSAEMAPFLIHMRDPFGMLQLWEAVLLGVDGASAHEALRSGDGRANRETVRETFELLSAYLEYVPEESTFMSSLAGDQAFRDGETAFFNNGTWGIGQYASRDGFDFGQQWDHAPFPGSDDCFLINMNVFVPSAMAENPSAARQFLAHAGSTSALKTFNEEVGSLPPRTDVDLSNFHPLTQRMGQDMERCRHQVPSITHGLGVTPDTLIELKSAVASFVADRDVGAVTDAFVSAFESEA